MRQVVATTVGLGRAAHPLPALVVTGVAAGLAVGAGWSAGVVATLTAAVLAGQLSVGWLNDLVDAGRDAAVGRTDKPLVSGRVAPRVVRAALVVAAPAAVLLCLPAGPLAAGAHLVALTSAWAYDLGVKSTPWSALPYAVSFGTLPAVVTLGLPGAPLPPGWLIAAAACLGCAAHVVNVLPDLADDAATGVRGLPHRLGPTASRLSGAALVLAASALLVLGPEGPPTRVGMAALPVAVTLVGAGLWGDRRSGFRAAFRAVLLVAALDVVLLLVTGVRVGRP